MAGRLSLAEVDLCCAICYDIFRDPVVLQCSHSFCSGCLRDYWASRGGGRDCPLCRRESSDEPVPSLTLRNLCEGAEPSSLSSPPEELYTDPGEMCPLHGERLKLFCRDDREPICVICLTSRRHEGHDCCPAGEAAADMKEDLKTSLSELQQKMVELEKMKQNYTDTSAHIEMQAQFVERRMHQEFQELRDFLDEAERTALQSLKQEEEEKRGVVRRLTDEVEVNISSLSDAITTLEEDMALDAVPLLHKCKDGSIGSATTPDCAAMPPGTLIDVASYLGSLQYSALVGMYETVRYTPVTLDPNTAAPWLRLSDDLTEVSDTDDRPKLPDNPERFDRDAGVLGHRGFSSGCHWWDVEVGENTAWVVGVAGESVKRKEKVSSVLKNGYVTVYFYHEMYFAGTSPLSRLNLKSRPKRIRVRLDYDKGRVSFHDADRNVLIYLFKHSFNEKAYPYLWVGCKLSPLKITAGEGELKVVK
ncbi:nuclear factor 7, ovary [Gadus morhua]|uniref:Nuclear factor 7, ovary-like n=1 Tax=Gadus morhua TaxID=8049 RepID=A0A8C4YYF1_GADMO|nr:nuclear factor 7, ovary-like [Gadus morhua]